MVGALGSSELPRRRSPIVAGSFAVGMITWLFAGARGGEPPSLIPFVLAFVISFLLLCLISIWLSRETGSALLPHELLVAQADDLKTLTGLSVKEFEALPEQMQLDFLLSSPGFLGAWSRQDLTSIRGRTSKRRFFTDRRM